MPIRKWANDMKMRKFEPNKKWARGLCSASENKKKKVEPSRLFLEVPQQLTRVDKSRETRTYHIVTDSFESNLIKKMNLDDMLEASTAIQMGTIGEEPIFIKSPKAQRYARTILALNKKEATKPVAAKMIDNLNTQIIRTNKRTTNAAESKRLYRNLMRET